MSTSQSITTVETVKYSTQLPPELIKWVKLQGIEQDVKDYDIIVAALEAYRAELQRTAPQPVSLFEPAA